MAVMDPAQEEASELGRVPSEAFERAVRIAGGQSELARRLGGKIKQGHIYLWLRIGVPAEYVLSVVRAVEFQVIPHELRRDLYPNPSDGMPEKTRAAA